MHKVKKNRMPNFDNFVVQINLIMYNFYILYFQTFMHFTFTTLASMYPFMSTLSFLFNWTAKLSQFDIRFSLTLLVV